MKAAVLLLNTAFYWGLIPFLLTAAGVKLDRLVGISSVSVWIGPPLGALLIGIGALGAAWCTVTLYLRGGGFPIAFIPPKRLVRAGPYGFSRHPLYLSFFIYLLGWAMVFRSVGAVGVSLAAAACISIYARLHEERGLQRRFGKDYENYKRDVPFLFRYRTDVPGPGILFTISYLVGKPILRALFPCTVRGKENVPQSGPAILIANHTSYLDPLFIFAGIDRYVRFLAKSEVMRSRFGRWFFSRTGSIPTNRYRVDPGSVRGLLSALREGEIVGLFPEGERTWDGRPLPVPPQVRRILARAGVPIVPVRIAGGYSVYPRWAGYPIPGPLSIEILPPVMPPHTDAGVDEALSHIATPVEGRTFLPRSARGIELVLWACPNCHEIGSIATRGRSVHCTACGMNWRLDRRLRLHPRSGPPAAIGELAASLPVGEILGAREELTSIGEVDLLTGEEELTPITTGTVCYRAGRLQAGGRSFPLDGARILRLEGKDRFDIGFAGGERLRLRFHQDSPLKWACFLRLRLGI